MGFTPYMLAWRMVSVARSTPGALAVPDAGHAVVGRGSGREIRLASPYRRGGELLVEARDEGDVVLGENLGHAVKHLVDATEGAALVTGDEGGNTLTCPNVANVLLDEAACNCLNTGQQHRSRSRPVPIIEVIGLGLGYARHQFSHRGPPFRLQCIFNYRAFFNNRVTRSVQMIVVEVCESVNRGLFNYSN